MALVHCLNVALFIGFISFLSTRRRNDVMFQICRPANCSIGPQFIWRNRRWPRQVVEWVRL